MKSKWLRLIIASVVFISLIVVVTLMFIREESVVQQTVDNEPLLESEVVGEESDENVLEEAEELDLEPEPEPEPVEPVIVSATIAGVGDILIHSSLYKDAYKDGKYDFRYMFENVKPYLSSPDITFANQETMLGGEELGLSSYPLFNSPYEVGDALLDVGIDVVSIANNHTLDAREQGILNALDYYDSVGMLYTGAYRSEEDKAVIRTIEANDIVFSFLAYSYGTNGLPIPEGKEYLINLIDIDQINADIIAAKDVSDVVVLSLHFGNEYQPLPNEEQKMLANEFAATGADIIFGHHPHVLQPMEWIEQEDGRRTFVAYSLGNFISGQEGVEREIGGIVQLEVVKTIDGDDVSISMQDPRFLPVFTYKKNWRSYKLHLLGDIGNDVLTNAEHHYTQTKDHVSQWMPELKFEWDE